jgi:hypothetical protein
MPSFVSALLGLRCPPSHVFPLVHGLGVTETKDEPRVEVIFPIEGPLELDYCGSSSVAKILATTTLGTQTFISTNPIDQWSLLGKHRGKGKFCIAMAWAFYALLNSPSNEVHSTSNLMEQLKCFFYYLVAPLVGQKRGVITYKTANDISTF